MSDLITPTSLPPSALDINLQALSGADSYRLTPATLAYKLTNGSWIPSKHLLYISAKIGSALAKGGARLIVSMPPRHGKSELLSIHTPAWILERNPSHYIILASYGSELATDFGRKSRDLILSSEDLLRVRLRRDSLQVSRFLTTQGGGMYAVGVGGPLTGRGANVLLIDDYLKNAKDASSLTIREDIWDWFISTAFTRLEPGGSVIIIATRWNIDDLIGRTIARTNQEWEHIVLPAFAFDDGRPDVLGRQPGEALWPERYDEDALSAIKNSLGTYFWQSLYQQQPIPRVAGLMQGSWLQSEDIMPHYTKLRRVRYWDFAASAEKGDYTSGTLMAEDVSTGLYHIENVIRFQKSPAETEQKVRAIAESDGPSTTICLEQEPGSSGKQVVSHYSRNVLKGFVVRAHRGTGDKFVRAQPFFAAAEAGNVRMLKGAWNATFIEELELFPEAPNDDQVDSATGAYNFLNDKKYRGVIWGREPDKSGAQISGGAEIVQGVTFGRRI